DEHHEGPRLDRLDLAGALDVDLDQHVAALGQPPGDRLPGGAGAPAEDVGPLQEPAGLDRLVEALEVHEVVVAALVLAVPRLAGGGRGGQPPWGGGGPDAGPRGALSS